MSRADVARPAAFLDRDGTLNVRPPAHDWLRSAEDFRWLPGAREGVARLASLGFVPVVVSNQQGVGLGELTPATLRAVERRIKRDLASDGCRIESFFYCLHPAGEGCRCRKPRPGLLLDAREKLNLDLRASWMIGDSASDVEAGRAAGCRTASIGAAAGADIVAASLREASELIARAL